VLRDKPTTIAMSSTRVA